jgi:hypothetical protein
MKICNINPSISSIAVLESLEHAELWQTTAIDTKPNPGGWRFLAYLPRLGRILDRL